jgi:amino acid adenylation domain-containing protein
MSTPANSNFPLSPEQQAIRNKRLDPWGTFVEFPIEEIEQSIPQRFEQQVRKYPDQIAVKTRTRKLTYDALNKLANRVAQAILTSQGVGQEPVALLLENDAPMIASFLGVLKSGKIYVPLDPADPLSRLQYLLEDSQSALIVSNGRNLTLAQELAKGKVPIINIDAIAATASDESPSLLLAPDALAYILYTSGSTGKPKGVVQNHRNVLHVIMWYTNRARITGDDRIALLRSFSVNGGTLHTFAALLNGAAILPFNLKEDGVGQLGKWFMDEGITICGGLGATAFNHFAASLTGGQKFPQLRWILFGGEPIHKKHVEVCRRHFSSECVIVNALGATEASNFCEFIIDKNTAIGDDMIPSGYPTTDMEILLLDEKGSEVGAGCVGEIAVKSRYIALGYWHRPQLTREKFLPVGDERLYLTGDLGLKRPDGCLLYSGRKDFQVKVRGYRIEIGEVEGALLDLENICNAAVAAREDSAGEKRLVAYIVAEKQPAPTATGLRRALRGRLPDFMVPSVFVVLDAMPVTPHGKLDRNALPLPPRSRPQLDAALIAPRSPVEKKLAQIWADVLSLDEVGIHDNFFDLGGHSLSATRIVSQVIKHFELEIPPKALFQSPTVAEMAAVITEHQERNRSEKTYSEIVSAAAFTLRPLPRDRDLPLSFAQQRLWFLDQYEPGSSVYNIFNAMRLTGALNVSALEQSVQEIVNRHEALRTTFSMVDGEAVQVIAPSLKLTLPIVDLSDIPEARREEEARRLAREEARRPFDLAGGSLVRATLISLAHDDHILLLSLHHIVSDGWSMGVLYRELSILYEAFCHDSPSPLTNLPIQYADFAVWQREWLAGEVLETQLSYWRKQLQDIPAVINLPTDRPRPKVQSYRGAGQPIELSKELTRELRVLSRSHDVTLYMTLLAAFQALLYRYTGQEDIAVGSPIAGRTREETEGLIGFFVNTLVLRSDLSGNPPFTELLREIRETTLEAYAHQDVPFEKLVEELHRDRNLGVSPLFQVMFVFQNNADRPLEFEGLSINPIRIESENAKFDLTLTLSEKGGQLRGTLNYNTDLFDRSTIQRMTAHLRTLLEGIVANPDQRIGKLPLLTAAEKHQLLVEWNDTKSDYRKNKCIQEVFEAQVEKTPDSIALVFESRQLSYRQLNDRANQLANHLKKLGIGAESHVGICMERSFDLIVGLLGILKAGAAYVPLEPTYPEDRLAFMLEDAQPKVLLTHARLRDKLAVYGGTAVCLDAEGDVIGHESRDNPSNETASSELAYMLYTSGSTGRPKGVMISHSAIVNHMHWMQDAFQFSETDAIVQKTPISFDASVWEVFAPLLAGSRLIVAQPQGHRDSAYLCRLIQEQGATVLQLVPSMLRLMLQDEAFTACTTLRLVFCGGEALPAELAQNFHARFGSGASLWNLYGPTEASIDATYWECKRDSEQAIVPIGRPIANTQVYILDANRNPVPIGVVGEIHIGGDGVARGYLNQPKLTAERFICHSFDGEPAQRLYRTGDLARYLPDGNIEFLGRTDNQVKIRGYRIELGEIEAVLTQNPAVRESAVIAREDRAGDKQLVAYIVPRESAPAISELRADLKAKLPEYMVPSAFVVLDSLPLTPNGKVDRKALPSPDRDSADLEQLYVAPRNAAEEIIAGIWAEILGRKRLGVHDNFFDRGGHSLKATQVVSRLRKVFQSEIPLRHLFEFPTIAELAAVIDSTTKTQSIDEKLDGLLTEIEAMTEIEAQRLVDKDIGSKVSD